MKVYVVIKMVSLRFLSRLLFRRDMVDKYLRILRRLGYGQVESVDILIRYCDYSYRDAKTAVFNSVAWADRAESTHELHEAFERMMDSEKIDK